MEKIKRSILFIIIMCFATSFSISAEDKKLAKEITLDCSISASDHTSNIKYSFDGRNSTSWDGEEDEYIDIKSQTPIGSIYVEWNKNPELWSYAYMDEDGSQNLELSCDTKFLHEYIIFDKPQNHVRITLKGSSAQLSEIYVFDEGSAPDFVQQWSNPYDKADMLLVSTHADDEHLYFGGTMPTYAGQQQKKVQVAYLTKHEVYRTHELLNGLWKVGITAYPLISEFVDQYAGSLEEAMKIYDEQEFLEYQVMLLRRFKPDVVIGHDINGEYGHGVHKLNAMTLCEALRLSNDELQFPELAKEYGVWSVQKCYLHLYWENPIVMDWDIPLNRFDGKTAFEMAVEGYNCHKSQLEFFDVQKSGPFDCRKFGLFHTTIGEDVLKNDFFENVVSTSVIEKEHIIIDASDENTEIFPPEIDNTENSNTPEKPEVQNGLSKTNYIIISMIVIVICTIAFLISKRK